MSTRFLTPEQAAEILNVQPQTLAKWRMLGEGPPYSKFGRAVRYPDGPLYEWAKDRTIEPVC